MQIVNYSLHYEIKGRGSITIVLLHGFGWHIGVWRDWTNHLQKYFRLILIDLPGHGESHSFPINVEYSLENIVKQVILCIKVHPAIWIGWSFGGLIAAYAALYYPSCVIKLILIAFSPKLIQIDASEDWPGIQLSQFKSLTLAIEDNIDVGLNRFLMLQCFQDAYFKQPFHSCKKWQNVKAIFNSKPWPSLSTLKNYLELLLSTDLRCEFAKIQIPTLIIQGDRDHIVPMEVLKKIKNGTTLNDIKTNPQFYIKIIPGAGHIPFITHQFLSLKILKEFIDDNKIDGK